MPPSACQSSGLLRDRHRALRHTYAYELSVSEGRSAPLVQAALGHSSLSTTDRYLRHIAPAELIESLSSREWSL